MLKNITIGQFFPGNSFLHKLDPRVKLILTIAFIVAIFLVNNGLSMFFVITVLVFLIVLSRVSVKTVLKSIKPVIPIIIFTSLLNALYLKGDTVLFHYGFITIYKKGLIFGLFIAVRIVCLIVSSSLLTYTTSPTDLTDGLERLMSPLRLFRLNVHELAMMMTIALRFVPPLLEETDKIMSAQKARGANLDSGGLIKRVKALLPIIIPLFVSSFRRAHDLAEAMECRCYRGGEGRTRMTRLKMSHFDIVAFVFICALIICIILINRTNIMPV